MGQNPRMARGNGTPRGRRVEIVSNRPSITTYEVEKILKSRGKGKNREVFVKWLGYPAKFNSWIPASEVKDI